MRILVASDDAEVYTRLDRLLEQETAELVIAECSALEVLAVQLREYRPDLLLLDWELPGRVAAALLFAPVSKGGRLKVVVLGSSPESEQAAVAAGADAFVYKGDSPEQLLVTCRRVMAADADNEV